MASVQYLLVTSSWLKTNAYKPLEMNVLRRSISEKLHSLEPKDHDGRTDGTVWEYGSGVQSKDPILLTAFTSPGVKHALVLVRLHLTDILNYGLKTAILLTIAYSHELNKKSYPRCAKILYAQLHSARTILPTGPFNWAEHSWYCHGRKYPPQWSVNSNPVEATFKSTFH